MYDALMAKVAVHLTSIGTPIVFYIGMHALLERDLTLMSGNFIEGLGCQL
jgi:hypothetical protein